jgi:Na+-transporting NADH:ubiquinone oxidoreductase subunit NqrC
MNSQSKTTFVVLAVAIAAVFIASAVLVTTEAEAKRKRKDLAELLLAAPIAASDNNVYITWWTNKTGNMEVMFRASTDNGVTFGDKMNLSNTTEADSDDAEIAASGNSVYVTWWERNDTSDTPIARVSNDNGATFGPLLRLAANGTIGGG